MEFGEIENICANLDYRIKRNGQFCDYLMTKYGWKYQSKSAGITDKEVVEEMDRMIDIGNTQ